MLLSVTTCLLVSVTIVVGQGGLLTPCYMNDLQCIKATTQQFLNNTAQGVPQLNIKQIENLYIPYVKYDFGKHAPVKHCLLNLTFNGLKNLQIDTFKMDTNTKQVELGMSLEAGINGKIRVEHIKNETKPLHGDYNANLNAKIVTSYSYELVTDDKGVEHYIVGPETNIYHVQLPIEIEINKELLRSLDDVDKKVLQDIYKEAMENILEIAVPTQINNLRQAAKMLPKNAFFKD